MTFHQPVLIQPASGDPSLVTTGQEFRNYTAALLGAGLGMPFNIGSGSGGVPDAGWAAGVNTGSLTVAQRGAGANFSVDVATGWVFVVGNDVTAQGTYACWNDGTVNVVTPGAPATGTRVHRLIVQIQDKLENGVWTGYQAVPVLLQDTGSGTPSAGASSVTLALISIAAGQSSVTNANITDYRRNVGPVQCLKTAATSRASTTALADDADLQLWGLANQAYYSVRGVIFYHGGTQGSSDLKWTFRIPGGAAAGAYSDNHLNLSGAFGWATNSAWADTRTAGTNGTSNSLTLMIDGTLYTGASPPNNFAAFQWAQNSSSGTATVIEAYSFLRAQRIG